MFQDSKAKFQLTETGVILSNEVPHALGDHLEMAVNYESIEVNMLKSSPVWKDYSFLAKLSITIMSERRRAVMDLLAVTKAELRIVLMQKGIRSKSN